MQVGQHIRVKYPKKNHDAVIADINEDGEHLLVYIENNGEISTEVMDLSKSKKWKKIVSGAEDDELVGRQIVIKTGKIHSDECRREKTAFVLSKASKRQLECDKCNQEKQGRLLYKVIYISDCWVTNLPLGDIDYDVIPLNE